MNMINQELDNIVATYAEALQYSGVASPPLLYDDGLFRIFINGITAFIFIPLRKPLIKCTLVQYSLISKRTRIIIDVDTFYNLTVSPTSIVLFHSRGKYISYLLRSKKDNITIIPLDDLSIAIYNILRRHNQSRILGIQLFKQYGLISIVFVQDKSFMTSLILLSLSDNKVLLSSESDIPNRIVLATNSGLMQYESSEQALPHITKVSYYPLSETNVPMLINGIKYLGSEERMKTKSIESNEYIAGVDHQAITLVRYDDWCTRRIAHQFKV